MAVEFERPVPGIGSWRAASEWIQRLHGAALPARLLLAAAGERLVRSGAVRLVTGSLLRRIIVSNLLGLLILVGGILYLSKHNVWLIDAKRESLRSQGEIIAAAIAANASVETERIVLDPDKLPEIEGALIPFRDDGFAALQLSIRPERVTPILRRLVQPTANRARIYSRDGTLITDSAQLLSRGLIMKPPSPQPRPRTKNLWTRLTQWFLNAELPVYKEIGNANGNFYPEVRMAMTGTTTPMLLLNQNGEQIVSIAVPIQRARSVQGVLLLSSKPGEIDDALSQERWTILKIALLALAAMIAASLLLARTVAGPMRRLSDAAEHVSHNISARHDLPGFGHRSDEVGLMATAFRNMTTALFRRIEASEKFAADVAHELKNPLTAARSTAEALAYARNEEERQQLIAQVQGELKRLNRLITDVSNASRLDAELALQQSEPVALCHVLDGIVTTFSDLLGGSGKSIALELEPSSPDDALLVSGHEGRLSQVITNIIDNAISFSPEGGTVLVHARRSGRFIEVRVEDEGPGIAPEHLEQVFKRFYTYRPTSESSRGNNSGLGLSISREIVLAHGGQIWAENRLAPGAGPAEPPLGARLVVRLPDGAQCAPQTRSYGHRGFRRA
ncbi:MAG: HAMP domain-containing histidine kinase [Hyphomicrobiaceae bacterium]|nr:HAMP domain-containing histidine kinase [Hyphomicrobiaceae bacterium]